MSLTVLCVWKARSCYLAIRYLAEYLNLPNLGNGNANRILEKEEEIKDRSSNFYQLTILEYKIPYACGRGDFVNVKRVSLLLIQGLLFSSI